MQTRLSMFFAATVLWTCTSSAQVTTKLIASGLQLPLWAGAPDGDERIFVAQKAGQIRIIVDGQLRATPFLDIEAKVSTSFERGLLGVAFHPAFGTNGFFFVNYTDTSGDTVVSRFTVSADRNVADPGSESVVLTQPQPSDNHNGGDLHFGPDGYLYVFLGDGGGSNDPACRAQKLGTRLGKILRVDIDSASPYAIPPTNPFVGVAGALPEIFHYGLRNPWRNSFDRLTGNLYIGDVGESDREEIDVAPAGSAGLNFGWKMMEGTLCNSSFNCLAGTPPCNDASLVGPILELPHANSSGCVTGGFVYRGWACPSEYGKYFFADFNDHHIRSLRYDTATSVVSELCDRTAELAPGAGSFLGNIASFGEDGFGELLIVDHSGAGLGEVFKMVPAGAPGATNVVRNGSGGNPACLTAHSLPILGNVWEARVDSAGHAGSTTLLLGYSAPASGIFLGRHEILLDAASRRRFLLLQPASGESDVFRAPVPANVLLAGVTLYVQAVVVGPRLQFCNALDVTPGYY